MVRHSSPSPGKPNNTKDLEITLHYPFFPSSCVDKLNRGIDRRTIAYALTFYYTISIEFCWKTIYYLHAGCSMQYGTQYCPFMCIIAHKLDTIFSPLNSFFFTVCGFLVLYASGLIAKIWGHFWDLIGDMFSNYLRGADTLSLILNILHSIKWMFFLGAMWNNIKTSK